jgi:hypothetical protein
MEVWCERWNIKINEDKTQAIYLSHGNRPGESHLTLNGWKIPFVNNIKYLSVNLIEKFHGDLIYKGSKPKPLEQLLILIPYSKVSIEH